MKLIRLLYGIYLQRSGASKASPLLLLALMLGSSKAHAHVVTGSAGEFSLWQFDPLSLLLLLALALVYHRGSQGMANLRRNVQVQRVRRRYFWSGWLVLFAALATPLDALGEHLFSVHMVQHELLMLGAAPLLVLSQPAPVLLKGSPQWLIKGFAALARSANGGYLWQALSTPAGAWSLHLLGLWGWHVPALFQAGLESNGMHILQHLSFVGISLLFWWVLLRGKFMRHNSVTGVLYLFTTTVQTGLLGALLTFSPTVWYPLYQDRTAAWGITALADQQLGGLIMWVPGSMVFLFAALVIMAKLLDDSSVSEQPPEPRSHQ